VISEREPNLSSNIRSVYVYCDLLEHVPVGDTKAPLLRIVKKSKELRYVAYLIRYCMFRCKKSVLYTVEIDMMIDTGDPVPFLSGKSFVVFEIPPVIHPYFAI